MVKLAGAVTMAIVEEYGPAEMLRRLADPWWFQAFGCVLGFDWHSSGLTTVTCGALKEAAKTCGADLGILVAGGKGATSRKTPQEIAEASDRHAIAGGDRLIYASRTSAKVDSAAVQDGFELYHHSFFFTPQGQWCVVQQGMNAESGWARRYHWLAEGVQDFVCEPHAAIEDLSEGLAGLSPSRPAKARQSAVSSPKPPDGPRQLLLLNMVAEEADANRRASAALVRESPDWLLDEIQQATEGPTLFAPARHPVLKLDVNGKRLQEIVLRAHEQNPKDFETLLGIEGVGAATVRSLSLLAEIIFQAPPSHRDPAFPRSQADVAATASPLPPAADAASDSPRPPAGEGPGVRGVHAAPGSPEPSAPDPPDARRWADYSHAHGGKDGTPFPVNRSVYDRNIVVLTEAVNKARLGNSEKLDALRRLSKLGVR